MTSEEPSDLALPEPWYFPDAEEVAHLAAELQRELPPGHLLFEVAVEVVAANHGNDDILVRHLRDKGRFTVVHLTWRGETELGPEYPSVEFDGHYLGFVQYESTHE